jgi:hypothetical protein
MTRVLDELAEALAAVEEMRGPRRVVSYVELWQQFRLPITPSRWAALARELACPLPPLVRRSDGLWAFPRGWTTVWDVAGHLAATCPRWEPPRHREAVDWQEAQVFVGVRACLVEALNVAPEQVVRPARLMADLGAE